MMVEIFARSAADASAPKRTGIFPSSIRSTRFFDTPARPTNRSRAKGGQVAIRSIGSTPGFAASVSGLMSVRFAVVLRASSTCFVVRTRASRNVTGANCMNQLL